MSDRSFMADLNEWRTSLTARVLSGGAIGFSFKTTGMMLQFAGTIALTRILGVDEYGVYAFLLVTVQLVTVPFVNGCRRILVRMVSEASVLGHWRELKGMWVPAQAALIVFTALLGFLALGTVYLFDPVILAGASAGAGTLVAWAALLPPLTASLRYHEGMLRGLGHIGLAQFPVMVLRPLFLVLFLISAALWLGQRTLGADSALALLSLSFAASTTFSMIWLRMKLPDAARFTKSRWHPARWSRSAAPFILVSGSQQLQISAGVLMLGALGGSSDVAYFHVANRLSELTDLVYLAAAIAIEPVVTRLYRSNDLEQLATIVTRIIRIVAIATLLVASAALIFGDSLLMLFGSGYELARPAFTILVIFNMVVVVLGMGDLVLSMTAHAGLVARVTIGSAFLTLVLCAALIPTLGATGAALGFATGLLPGKFYMWWRVRQLLGIDTSITGRHRQAIQTTTPI